MRYAIFTILALSLLLAACGGAPAQTTTDTTTTETSDTAAPGTNAPETGAAETKTSAPTADAKDDFDRAIEDYMGGQFMVEYSLTSSVNGVTESGTMSQYFGGVNRMRTDSTFEGVESRIYIVNEEFVSCFMYEGDWQCSKLPEAEESEKTDVETGDLSEYAENNAEYTVSRDGTKQVAGVTADCFKVTEEQGLSRYCIYDSIPLYVKTEYDGGMSELTATKYKKGVSNSDFTYPATPTEGFGGYDMGGGAAGTLPEGFEMPEGYDAEAYAYQ